jgi:two-component system copper resistance phosphate regulon response regulator CusR
MKILLVEDEKKIANYLKKGLTESGLMVDLTHEGQEAINLALCQAYQLIILDIMLPDVAGWSVLTRLRQHHIKCPILMLTARDAVVDRVKGLNLGADDYLTKPFAFSELLARINALLRRGQPTPTDNVLCVGDLMINFEQHKAWRDQTLLNLSPKEFLLLGYLARNQKRLLSRTQIAEQIWGINFDSDTNVIDVAIRRLRKKIDDPYTQKLIHTVHGIGYVLESR